MICCKRRRHAPSTARHRVFAQKPPFATYSCSLISIPTVISDICPIFASSVHYEISCSNHILCSPTAFWAWLISGLVSKQLENEIRFDIVQNYHQTCSEIKTLDIGDCTSELKAAILSKTSFIRWSPIRTPSTRLALRSVYIFTLLCFSLFCCWWPLTHVVFDPHSWAR